MAMLSARSLMFSAALGLVFGALPAAADEASDGLARANEIIEPYQKTPEYKPGGEAFDIRAIAKGKKVLSIPNTSSNQFLKGIIAREIEVGKEIGLEVREWEIQGQPAQWVQGAIANKFDVVDLISGASIRR